MRWLVHGTVTPEVSQALVRHGHVAQSSADLGLTEASSPVEVLKTAHEKQLDVLTNQSEVVECPYQTYVRFGRSLVYLQLPGGPVEHDAIDRLFERYPSPKPGMLYTVTETRVKVRQLPTTRRKSHSDEDD